MHIIIIFENVSLINNWHWFKSRIIMSFFLKCNVHERPKWSCPGLNRFCKSWCQELIGNCMFLDFPLGSRGSRPSPSKFWPPGGFLFKNTLSFGTKLNFVNNWCARVSLSTGSAGSPTPFLMALGAWVIFS